MTPAIGLLSGWRGTYLRVTVLAALLSSIPALAQQLPPGTKIPIRLKTQVSTQSSRFADRVDAVVIAPVLVEGRLAIAAGAMVRGSVEKVAQSASDGQRALLLLHFTELETGGAPLAIDARVASIDNAREKVDEQGQINGILASETLTGNLDAGLIRLGQQYSGFADILSAAKKAVFQPAATGITYGPGVEMWLRLAAPLKLAGSTPPQAVAPIADHAALVRLISSEPFQTIAQRPLKPSDITNLLLVGDEAAVRRAFAEAGWSIAAALNPVSRFETVRALAEDRGYSEAPVSVLLLDGKPPDLVLEKTTNTFARRHHLRIWRRPGSFRGKPVWAVAATHDIGIDFSAVERTFIHRIDSQIDGERNKVVNDLMFTGHVDAFDLVERPAVPRRGRNATGDDFETDGRIAVLLLHRL